MSGCGKVMIYNGSNNRSKLPELEFIAKGKANTPDGLYTIKASALNYTHTLADVDVDAFKLPNGGFLTIPPNDTLIINVDEKGKLSYIAESEKSLPSQQAIEASRLGRIPKSSTNKPVKIKRPPRPRYVSGEAFSERLINRGILKDVKVTSTL
jgi:hypothetical protein